VRVTFAYRNEGRRSVSDADDKRVYAEDSEIEASDLPLGADAWTVREVDVKADPRVAVRCVERVLGTASQGVARVSFELVVGIKQLQLNGQRLSQGVVDGVGSWASFRSYTAPTTSSTCTTMSSDYVTLQSALCSHIVVFWCKTNTISGERIVFWLEQEFRPEKLTVLTGRRSFYVQVFKLIHFMEICKLYNCIIITQVYIPKMNEITQGTRLASDGSNATGCCAQHTPVRNVWAKSPLRPLTTCHRMLRI